MISHATFEMSFACISDKLLDVTVLCVHCFAVCVCVCVLCLCVGVGVGVFSLWQYQFDKFCMEIIFMLNYIW